MNSETMPATGRDDNGALVPVVFEREGELQRGGAMTEIMKSGHIDVTASEPDADGFAIVTVASRDPALPGRVAFNVGTMAADELAEGFAQLAIALRETTR